MSELLVPRAMKLAGFLKARDSAEYYAVLDAKFGSDARFAAEELELITFMPGRPGWYIPHPSTRG